MKFSNSSLIKVLLFSLISNLHGSLIEIESGNVGEALQADGVLTLSSAGPGAFSFTLGTFNESSLSDAPNLWLDGFTNQMSSTSSWLTSPPIVADRFQAEISMMDGSATGSDAYILGFNGQDASQISLASQIIIFKNSSWVFPTFVDLDLTADQTFSLQDAGTEVLLSSGQFSNYSGSFTMINVVPEPSTYALFVGILAIGYIAVVRRRRS